MVQSTLYFLDTNILLHDPQSLNQFPYGTICICFPVISELDAFKKEGSERGYNAREVIRMLDELRQRGSLMQGIELPHGGMLKVVISSSNKELVDDQILETALHYRSQGNEVVLVSKDIALRIKADSVGLSAHDYQALSITKDTFYQGWKEFLASAHDIKNHIEHLLQAAQKEYTPTINEFFIFRCQHADHIIRIFRYTAYGRFKEINATASLWGIVARNAHQAMVIDLLMDDEIKLVILLGPSGTGKTLLVLATLLYKVLVENVYKRLLVSRPLVPLGNDIGFLPGDLQEKLQTWMQPVRDNLEFLIYQINLNACKEQEAKGYKQKKNDRNAQEHRPGRMTVESLLGPHSRVALEAITYMRGRSIPYQAIFIDEVQNLTPHEVKTLISRAGDGSKVILAGDPYQIDSPYLDFASNGLVVACERFKGQEIFGTVYLQISERSILSSLANELM